MPYPEQIAPLVIQCLEDSNYQVRFRAANTLGDLQRFLPDLAIRFPEAVPQLIRMLSDRDPEDKHQKVRRMSAYALCHLRKASKAAVPELLKIAVDKKDDVAVRAQAVQALGWIGHASPEVVAALIGLLDDPARINEGYPRVGGSAGNALAALGADAKAALPVLIERLGRRDPMQRGGAAGALGRVGVGSLKAEIGLLGLLDDDNAEVRQTALSSLERINSTYEFLFHNNTRSREVREKQQAFVDEARRDPERKRRLARILAAQLRSDEKRQRHQLVALRRLVDLEAKEYLPLIKKHFDQLKKKSGNLALAYRRYQLLPVLAAWLPDKEIVPFLMAVDSDVDEAPLVRFRAAVLLCERGDAPSVAHTVKQHFPQAKKTKSLTVEEIRKSLHDRRLFGSDDEFDSLKPVAPEELSRIQTGIQLAQYLYHYQRRGEHRTLSVTKVRVAEGQITGIRFRLSAASEGWSFELRKKGEWWLPHDYRMTVIR